MGKYFDMQFLYLGNVVLTRKHQSRTQLYNLWADCDDPDMALIIYDEIQITLVIPEKDGGRI
jgi:hypothetical protein